MARVRLLRQKNVFDVDGRGPDERDQYCTNTQAIYSMLQRMVLFVKGILPRGKTTLQPFPMISIECWFTQFDKHFG